MKARASLVTTANEILLMLVEREGAPRIFYEPYAWVDFADSDVGRYTEFEDLGEVDDEDEESLMDLFARYVKDESDG